MVAKISFQSAAMGTILLKSEITSSNCKKTKIGKPIELATSFLLLIGGNSPRFSASSKSSGDFALLLLMEVKDNSKQHGFQSQTDWRLSF